MARDGAQPRVIWQEEVGLGEPTEPTFSPEAFAAALGAEAIAHTAASDPITLHNLGAALLAQLQSTGGRPSIPNTQQRKIPLRDEDVTVLKQIADVMRRQFHINVTWTQAASMLLSLSLSWVAQSPAAAGEIQPTRQLRQLAAELAQKPKDEDPQEG